MKSKTWIIFIGCIAIIFFLLWSNYKSEQQKKEVFAELGQSIEGHRATTGERVAKAVVTLPDNDIIVGLQNNTGSYILKDKAKGTVKIQNNILETHFIPGIYKIKDPRLDAITPMSISADSYGGSMYIVLWQDRGDAALEKSYARLGGLDVVINDIGTLPTDGVRKAEEYKVVISYTQKSLKKEVTIPVVDGHFDPKNTTTK